MDALKEHRLLLTLIGGVALSILVYMFVVAPARQDASEDLLKISNDEIRRVSGRIGQVPDAGEIRLRTQQRHEALRELYELYRVYLEWGRPLLTYDIPGVDMERADRYRANLAIYLDEMQLIYAGDPDAGIDGVRHPVPVDDEGFGGFGDEDQIEEPFASAEGRGDGFPRADTSDDIELNRKQFWVLFELLQILRETTEQVEQATGEKPYCQIERLQFPMPPREDASGVYQGLGFEMTLHVSVEVWPRLMYALHESPRNDMLTYEELERVYNDGDGARAVLDVGEATGGSNRIGLRFDRLAAEVEVGPVSDEFSVRLSEESLAQQIFLEHFDAEHWNDENNRVIAPPIPQETVDRLERIPDDEERAMALDRAFRANQQAFFDRMANKMYEELQEVLGPETSYLSVTLEGEAVDFLHDLESAAVRFWDRLELSSDDVVEMLKRGEDDALTDDPETWHSCDFIEGERTNQKPVYVPFEMTVQTEDDSHTLDPYTPYRMSEAALRLVAHEVRPEAEEDFE